MILLIRLIRLYTPFICSIMALVNGVLFLDGQKSLPVVYLCAALTGNSVLLDLFMLAASFKMCIWYKLNVICLILIQILGLMYSYFNIVESLYAYAVIVLASMAILAFLIFKILYKVTSTFGCIRRH